MKPKLLFVPCVLALLPLTVSAGVVELVIDVPAADLAQDAQGFTHARIPGYEPSGRPGAPELPARAIMVALPPNEALLTVETRVLSEGILPGSHVIFPAQRKYPTSHRGLRPFTQPDLDLYLGERPHPTARVEPASVQFSRGVPILPVLLRPLEYRPRSGELRQIFRVELRVTTAPGKNLPPTYRGRERDLAWLSDLVENPKTLSAYPVRPPAKDGETRYLIVTGAGLESCPGPDNLQALAAARTAEGLPARLVTMDEVRAAFSEGDDAEKLRAFIAREYHERGSDFVLLAGDADLAVVGGETESPIVPARGLWGDIDYGGPELNLVSDLYYAALDGDFDKNRNRVFGEEDDEPDLLPDIAVGRAPADSCAEIAHFVKKTLEYAPRRDDGLKSAWFAGEILAPGAFGCEMLDMLIDGSAAEGIPTRGFADSAFFEIHRLCEPMTGHDEWTQDEILAVLNGGVHLLNHVGHSMTNDNMRLNCDVLDQRLENEFAFFDYSGGCYPGSFDNRLDPVYSENRVSPQDSFAEHLLLGAHGAFGVVMFTRFGVGDLLQRTFWDAVFGHGLHRLGEIHNRSRIEAAAFAADRYVRWQLYSLTLFGDPALAIHTSQSDTPLIGLPAGPVQLVARAGDAKSYPQRIHVRNDGGGELAFTASADQPWLEVTPASGTAPAELTLQADIQGMAPGYFAGSLSIRCPAAQNSPQTVPVQLFVLEVADRAVPFVAAPPVLDGTIGDDEYPEAAFMDVGLVAPGYSVGKMVHDGRYLYLGLRLLDDPTPETSDALILLFDNDNDDRWPAAPGSEGVFGFYGEGTTTFQAAYNAGNGFTTGPVEYNPPGVQAAFGMQAGSRIVEARIDMQQSYLKRAPGDSFGFMLEYFDYQGGAYPMVGFWPSSVGEIDDAAFLANMALGLEPDVLMARPSSLVFQQQAGLGPTAVQLLHLSATTAAALAFSVSSDQPWLHLEPAQGTLPAVLDVQADATGLDPGNYVATLWITAAGAKNSPLAVPIAFEVVEPPPAFSLSPERLDFSMREGTAAPDPQALAVRNAGGGALDWTVLAAGNWLSAAPASGSGDGVVSVSVSAQPAGSYSGLLLFTAPGAPGRTVPVTLRVDPVDEGGGGCQTSSSGGLTLAVFLLVALRRRNPVRG